VVGLFLVPFAAGSADYGSSPPNYGEQPPVAQPLVREGDFAIRLAAQLDLGAPADEATAEDMLARVGVAPLNGWLSDYPMTPQIIGQLQESVSLAASEGKLPMTADQAVRGLLNLAAEYRLPTPADPRSPAPDNGAQPATAQQADQAVINNYYGNYGPPIVTYYPPPPDYFYLYAWVPYPYWWFGFWYPGFYICNSFTTVVVVRPGVRAVVTNRFIDHHTRRVVVVDPNGARTGRSGRDGPDSVLRTGHGDRYRSFADMRNGVHIAGPAATVHARGERDRGPGAGRFSSEGARRGAESIYSRSMGGAGAGRSRSDNITRTPENRSLAPGPGAGAFNKQRIERSRDATVPSQTYNDRPAPRGDSYPERRPSVSARPSGGDERRSWQAMPGDQFRSNNGSGRAGSQMRSITGERGFGRDERGGGSFPSGGACRGGRC
jgi:hypothetical protein